MVKSNNSFSLIGFKRETNAEFEIDKVLEELILSEPVQWLKGIHQGGASYLVNEIYMDMICWLRLKLALEKNILTPDDFLGKDDELINKIKSSRILSN